MTSKKKTSAAKPAVEKTESAALPLKKKAVGAKSAAATHKTPVRKAKAVAVKEEATQAAASTHVFDASAHHGEIAKVAYFLWIDGGAHHGRQQDDWHRAVE